MANKKAKRTCEQCFHEHACQAWNMGIIQNMDAEDDAYSRGCLAGIELGHKEALCGITQKDAKSMINTLDMFKSLAFNIHGVIDIVDDRNIEQMKKILNQVN